jgi:hypothetical protein
VNIVIYTSPETLLHKREPNQVCYWTMKRPPKKLKEGDRVYFAIKGEIQGYFIVNYFDPEDKIETIVFKSDSWVQLNGIEPWAFCKPFRGFRYQWWKD